MEDGLRMIGELRADRFRILLDTGHANVNGEDFSEIVPKCKGIPFHIHIDDNDGSFDSHQIPGEGNIDFNELSQSLKETGYKGFISAELGLAYIMEPSDACRTSLTFLEKTFKT